MKVRFWGVRGSIPAPGPATVRYGGNTTCIEVTTDAGHTIILDAGTGIRPLGLSLMERAPVSCSLFISHTHWDHIQGLPFFTPLFATGNKVSFYGAFDPVYQKDLQTILAQQMEYCYFPVRELELKADMEYHTLHEGTRIEVADAVITNVLMNHPVLTYGYRIDCNGKSLFFSGDHEPPHNIYQSEENQQRYVGVAILRGERTLENTLPNVAPALVGQMRARVIHLLSGAVVVEVILRIDGLGDLLWGGTLKQDFGVVLGAATLFGAVSAVLLLIQAFVEIVVALHVRRAPSAQGVAS